MNLPLKIKIGKLKAKILNFSSSKQNSPSLKYIDRSRTTTQENHIHNNGLTVSDAKALIDIVIETKMIGLRAEAETVYQNRMLDFKEELFKKLSSLSEEEMGRLKEPDAQFALKDAAQIGGRKESKDIIQTLSNLVIGRIKNASNQDLKNVVYNEAIITIGKLTIDQLKIITLCYLLRYTVRQGIKTWEAFSAYIEQDIKPFLHSKNTNAEFQHIEYAGCGSLGVGQWNILGIYRNTQEVVFQAPYTQTEVDNINLPLQLKQVLFIPQVGVPGSYNLLTSNAELDKMLTMLQFPEEEKQATLGALAHHQLQEVEIRTKIETETNSGRQLFIEYDKNLKHLSLTSVGIVIAATYYQQVTGRTIDIDIWIN